MRQIKFRAWVQEYNPSKEAATMVYSDRVGGVSVLFRDFEDDPIMQYTGLKDANGVEIYEGDIIECWGSTLVVYWEDSDASFFAVNTDANAMCESGQEWSGRCKVIGNIYQNKELLDES